MPKSWCRGARCGIGLFVVRVLRGMVWCVAPLSLVSLLSPPDGCLRALSGIPIRIRQDAAAVYLW